MKVRIYPFVPPSVFQWDVCHVVSPMLWGTRQVKEIRMLVSRSLLFVGKLINTLKEGKQRDVPRCCWWPPRAPSPVQLLQVWAANSIHLPLLQMLGEGCLRGNATPSPHFPPGVACGQRLTNVAPAPCPQGGTASVVPCILQSPLQGREEADSAETTFLPTPSPAPPCFPPASTVSPKGSPSISSLLKNLHFRLYFLGIQTKTCAIKEAQERWCLVSGSGKICLED